MAGSSHLGPDALLELRDLVSFAAKAAPRLGLPLFQNQVDEHVRYRQASIGGLAPRQVETLA